MSIANHNQFLPIMTSSGQPMPILTNPMPIQGQSAVNLSPQPIILICQSLPILENPCQSGTIRCQSRTDPLPIPCQSDANPGPFLGPIQNQSDPILPIQANPVPIRCQSLVIFGSNINSPTSKTCQFQLIPPDPCQPGGNPWSIFPSNTSFKLSRVCPIRANLGQFKPIHVNPGQSGANPWLIRDHLRS